MSIPDGNEIKGAFINPFAGMPYFRLLLHTCERMDEYDREHTACVKNTGCNPVKREDRGDEQK